MHRQPPRSTRTDTLFPYTTLFRSGLVLGAGIGVAAAGQDSTSPAPDPVETVTSMDEMHATMVETMPAELAEQCNEMHAAMADHMGDGDHASKIGRAHV